MSQVGIDLMKLCKTDRFEEQAGFQYIITAQCYFMKYVEIGALRTKMDLDVANWIYTNIFCHYCALQIFTLVTGELNSAIWCPKSFTKNVE